MAKTKVHRDIQKQKRGLTVIGNPLVNKFMASSPPSDLRSKHYSYQAALGIVGIFFIFLSFKVPALFFAGAILLFVRRQWRLKTDDHAMSYRLAITALKKKKYIDCIQHLNKITYEGDAIAYLDLVKASCYLEVEDTESAYTLYKNYFNRTPSSHWSDMSFCSARENAIILSLEHNNIELAKKILYDPEEQLTENKDNTRWKAKFAKIINDTEL